MFRPGADCPVCLYAGGTRDSLRKHLSRSHPFYAALLTREYKMTNRRASGRTAPPKRPPFWCDLCDLPVENLQAHTRNMYHQQQEQEAARLGSEDARRRAPGPAEGKAEQDPEQQPPQQRCEADEEDLDFSMAAMEDFPEEGGPDARTDWMAPTRNDGAYISAHPWSGQVVLLPLVSYAEQKTTTGALFRALDLPERARCTTLYSRWRILRVDTKEEKLTVYNIDSNASFEDALEEREHNHYAVQEVAMKDLSGYGTFLHRVDVLMNPPNPDPRCEVCGGDERLIRCDGNSPLVVWLSFISDPFGRSFACVQGAICEECFTDREVLNLYPGFRDTRKKTGGQPVRTLEIQEVNRGTAGAKRWFCAKRCMPLLTGAKALRHEDLWGYQITPPLGEKGALRPGMSWRFRVPYEGGASEAVPLEELLPAGDDSDDEEQRSEDALGAGRIANVAAVEQPYDRIRRSAAERAVRMAEQAVRLLHRGNPGQAGVDLAALLVGWMRRNGISTGASEDLCRTLRVAQEEGLLANGTAWPTSSMSTSDASRAFLVPAKWETLVGRAEAKLLSAADLPHRLLRTDVTDLRQIQQTTTIAAADVLDCLQSIIADDHIPNTQFLLRGQGRQYTNAAGEPLLGPELHQGGRLWADVEATVEDSNPRTGVIMLVLWNDGVEARAGEVQPLRISLGNYMSTCRFREGASRLVALLGCLKIRAPHGSKTHEVGRAFHATAERRLTGAPPSLRTSTTSST